MFPCPTPTRLAIALAATGVLACLDPSAALSVSDLPVLASSYGGAAHNTTYNVKSGIRLANVAESETGELSGELLVEAPLYGSGPFTGTIAGDHIQFVVTPPFGGPVGLVSESYTGEVTPGGALRGSYVTSGESEQTGTWEVSPVSAGPTPTLARTVLLRLVSGSVSYKLPGVSQATPLTGTVLVPNGTEVDAIEGDVEVMVASGGAPAEESALLYEGQFVVDQESTAPYETHFVLSQPLTGCGLADGATAHRGGVAIASGHDGKRTTKRHLWAQDGGGSFGTTGRYVSTTVEGTHWLTSDECTSSSVTVTQGTVAVLDLVTHRTTVVHAGKHYVAGNHGRESTAAARGSESGPLAVLESYWAAIRAHDFGRAFRYLTASAAGASEAQFIASERREGVRNARFRGRIDSRTRSTATIDVVSLVTHDRQFGCRTWRGDYQLVDHEGGWLIARANLKVRSCGR